MEGAKTANLKVTETDVNTVRTRRGGYLLEDTDVLFQEHKNHGVKTQSLQLLHQKFQ